MSGRSATYTIAEQSPFNIGLTFPAQSVMVHNITASWLFVNDSTVPVPPFQYGAVIPFNASNSNPRITWQTPADVSVPTARSGNATVIFTEELLPPSAGQPILTPTQQTQCIITASIVGGGTIARVGDTIVTTPNLGTGIITFSVPPGTNSLILTGTAGSNAGVSLTGTESGTVYYTGSSPNPAPPVATIFSSSADKHVTLNFGGSSTSVGTYRISASPATQAVFIEDSGAAPIAVTNPAGGVLQVMGKNFGPVVVSIPNSPFANLTDVGAIGTAAGGSAILFNLLDTVSHRYIYELSLSAVGNGAGSGSAFLSIKGHTTGTTKNILIVSTCGVNIATAQDRIQRVWDVQSFLSPATDVKYDILYNSVGIASNGCSAFIVSPTSPVI